MRSTVFCVTCLLTGFALAAPRYEGPQPEKRTAMTPWPLEPTRVQFVAPPSRHHYVRLEGRWIDPLRMRDADGRTVAAQLLTGPVQDNMTLIQLDRQVSPEDLRVLARKDYRVLGMLPYNTLLVSGVESSMTAPQLDGVRWLGPYLPTQRYSERLRDALDRLPDRDIGAVIDVRVFFHPEVYLESSLAAVGTLADIRQWDMNDSAVWIDLSLPRADLGRLARLEWVMSIDYAPRPRLLNNESAGIVDIRTTWNTRGYFGSNEVVAVADTGLDIGTAGTAVHADFLDGGGASRVLKLYDVAGDGPADTVSGHGTHVAGTVLGSGLLSGAVPLNNFYPSSSYAGMAPKATLIFQALGRDSDPDGVYPPANLHDLFRPPYDDGARIHQDSWGLQSFGAYTKEARQLDEFCYYHQNMLVCFGAGNLGRDSAPSDGVIDCDSLNSPATAKNCLTVGASENLRPTVDVTYGALSPSRFPNEPIASDSTTDDSTGLAAFSSRGPCDDGRIKPDVVAPGTHVISTRSHAIPATNRILSGNAGNSNYAFCSGTSMSSAQAAGAAAVLREYLRRARGIVNPPAALLKAMLVNGALDLAPGQYGTVTQELSRAPGVAQGWGLIQLDNALYGDETYRVELFGHDRAFTAPGRYVTNVTVYDTTTPLRVHLAWTDFPASLFSLDTSFTLLNGGGLVNDLDLRVIAPDATTNVPFAMDPRCNLSYYTNQDTYAYLAWPATGAIEAVHCTAPELPLAITNVQLMCHNINGTVGSVRPAIWAADGTNGSPGTLLFSQSVAVPGGAGLKLFVLPAPVTITTTNFYMGVIVEDTNIAAARDTATSTLRTWFHNGAKWDFLPPGFGGDMWMHAYGTCATGDHNNTIEGLEIARPHLGTYTLVVSAQNLPYPASRFGLVASGGLAPEPAGALSLALAAALLGRRVCAV